MSREPAPDRPHRGRVLFVITEDWFFVSHFLRLAQAVQAAGYDVGVHLRINDRRHRERIERAGIRVLASTFDRGAAGVLGNVGQVFRFATLFRREKPDVVHLISLRVVVLAGIAARLTAVPVRVHALTGLGLLGAGKGAEARAAIAALGFIMRRLGGRGGGHLFENDVDPQRLGFRRSAANVRVVGGAGIDPLRETALPMPAGPSLRIAIVSRMVRSKGIPIAVEALRLARERGADVALTLVGDVDLGNPRSLTSEDLHGFDSRPGIAWVGPTDDVRAVWRDHHVACVPSLGGEGLPRSLLEAAAAGRPIVTTDTPGCASFVRPLREGLVVPPGDATAMASAFSSLAMDRKLVHRLGTAARSRVLDGFTTEAVAAAVIDFYRELSEAAGHASS